jgi:CheY-like chemotaxis protein
MANRSLPVTHPNLPLISLRLLGEKFLGNLKNLMKTILVVEDFVAVQQFLREMLESKGYRTLGATNGDKAYDVLRNHAHSIDLVITDYHMPDSTGYDLLMKIKTNQETKSIPVIFLTAESDPIIERKVGEIGIAKWIKKPYRSDALFTEIEKAMRNQPTQWNLFHSN